MRDATISGFKPERTADGFKALVSRGAATDGRVFVSVSADVATRIDADPSDHIWSAEGSLRRDGSETVMSTPCDLTLDEAAEKAVAFLRRFVSDTKGH